MGTAGVGANLSVEGILDKSLDIKGTNKNWQQVELYGRPAREQSGFFITLGIGGYGSLNTGKAWFDDVQIEESAEPPSGVRVIDLSAGGTLADQALAAGSVSGGESVQPVAAISPVETSTGNLVGNPGFEKPWRNEPANWYSSSYHDEPGVTDFLFETGWAHTGKRFVTIRNNRPNDARFYQNVPVVPNTIYKLSVWVRAEGCGEGQGATICSLDALDVSRDIKDTGCAWELLELYGRTGRYQRDVPVGLRLGGNGSLTTGRVSFDDVSLTPVTSLPPGVTITSFSGASSDMDDNEILRRQNERNQPQNLSLFYYFLALIGVTSIGYGLYHKLLKGKIRGLDAVVRWIITYRYYILGVFLALVVLMIYGRIPYGISALGVQLAFVLVFTALSAYAVWLLYHKRLDNRTLVTLIILLGIMLRFCYVFYTDFNIRQHDIHGNWGHLGYIKYVAENAALPPTGEWQTYHPPVHYLLSALVVNVGRCFGWNEYLSFKFVQLLMVLFSSLSLIYFRKIMERVTGAGLITLAAVTLFAFHPTNIFLSSTINNDNTFLFFYVLSFFFMMKWLDKPTTRTIVPVALFTSLAILTKKTAVELLPLLLIVFLVKLWHERHDYKAFLRQFAVFFAIIIPLSASFYLRNYILFQQGFSYLAPSFGPPLSNSSYNMLYVSWEGLFKTPFNNVAQGQFFLEYLYKSSLYGEWKFPGQENVAVLLTIASVLVFGLMSLRLLLLRKEEIKGHGYMFLLNLIIPFFLVVQMRMADPHACTQNFRYLAPILISGAYFIGLAVESLWRSKYIFVKYLGLACVLAFSALSALFILGIGLPPY